MGVSILPSVGRPIGPQVTLFGLLKANLGCVSRLVYNVVVVVVVVVVVIVVVDIVGIVVDFVFQLNCNYTRRA